MKRSILTRTLASLPILCLCSSTTLAAIIRVDAGAQGAAHDGTSWATACSTIQAGLKIAAPGDELWVAKGIYVENVVMPDYTSLYGGFAGNETSRVQRDAIRNVTTIDANHHGTAVTMSSGAVDGFTIQNANDDPSNYLSYGGGIDSEHGVVLITNNIIQNNAATGYGGGIFCVAGEVAFNTLVNNTATQRGGGVGVWSWTGAVDVHNNIIMRNFAPNGGAFASGVLDATFTNNLVIENKSLSAAVIFERGTGLCANNTVVGNHSVSGMGSLECGIGFDGGMPVVANNIVAFNDTGLAAWDGNDAPVDTISCNCVYGNGAGDYALMPDKAGIDGNLDADPHMVDPNAGNYRLAPGSPCIDAGTDAVVEPAWTDLDGRPRQMGSHVDIGAYEVSGPVPPPPSASRVYLSPAGADSNDGLSWAHAKRGFHAAALTVAKGGELWLAAGEYLGFGRPLPAGVSVYGGFAGTESERGQRDPTRNIAVIRPDRGAGLAPGPDSGPETVMDGFTIDASTKGGGPGIACDKTSPTVSDIRFVACDGGVSSTGGSPVVVDNTLVNCADSVVCLGGAPVISGNWILPGGAYGDGRYLGIKCTGCNGASVRNNTIALSSGWSGGVLWTSSTGTIDGNVLTNCGAAALDPEFLRRGVVGISGGGSNVTFSRNTVTAGAQDAVVCFGGATVRLADNVLTLNGGAAVVCDGATVTVDNNTVVRNGGVLGAVSASSAIGITLRNNLVVFNAAGISLPTAGAILSHNCLYGNLQWDYSGASDPTGKNGNIRVDPRFAGLDYGDLHLTPTSLCRNAGDDVAALSGETDVEGRPRILGQHVDIGAFESDGTVHSWPASTIRVSPAGNDAGDGSSWTRAKRTLQGAINALPVMGGEIWVAAGIYREAVTVRTGTRVYAGFAGWESSRDQRNSARNVSAIAPSGGDVVFPPGLSGVIWDGFRLEGVGLVCASSAVVSHNAFVPGSGAGTAASLSAYSGSPVIVDNLFSGCGTGPALGVGTGSPIITNNTFIESVTAISLSQASPRITNNLMAYGGTAVSADHSAAVLRNNCVFGNDTDFKGLTDPTGANGNIRSDPRLVSPAFGDARLQPNSPCVDAGDNSSVAPGDTDLAGKQRVLGGKVDIGAYESDGSRIYWAGPLVVRVAATGNDRWDGSSWTRAKRTVQAAVDSASAAGGGEVWVSAGTYRGNVMVPPFAYVYGGYPRVPALRAGRDPVANRTLILGDGTASAVTVGGGHRANRFDGFSVRLETLPSGTTYPNAISVYSGSPVISSCTTETGSVLAQGGAPVVIGCHLNGGAQLGGATPTLTSSFVRGGVSIESGARAAVTNCVITGSSGAGISGSPNALWCVNNTIVGNASGVDYVYPLRAYYANNIIAFNGTGFYTADARPVNFRNNCVFGNADDFRGGKDPTGWAGNIRVDPRLAEPMLGTVSLLPDSPCRDAGDNATAPTGQSDAAGGPRIVGSAVDMGALESDGSVPRIPALPVFRVSLNGNDANNGASWETALRTVRAGLAAAKSVGGAEVWVAKGIFAGGITLDAYTYLYGGFVGTESARDKRPASGSETVLDGGGHGPVVTAPAGYRNCVVDGFTIRNGRGTPSCGSPVATAIQAAAPILNRLLITDNGGYPYPWGGIAPGPVVFSTGPGMITDCDVMDNLGTGIQCTSNSPALIARNLVSGNTGSEAGGGIYIAGYGASVTDNVIVGNKAHVGGGIYAAGYSSAVDKPLIANNTIVANSSDEGGCVVLTGNRVPGFYNNIVANNTSGVMVNPGYSGSTPGIRNNDVFSNTGAAYINLADLTGVNGNLALDPFFLDWAGGDWRLRTASPCVDSGNDTVVDPGEKDFYGNPRIIGAHVDIGAAEAPLRRNRFERDGGTPGGGPGPSLR